MNAAPWVVVPGIADLSEARAAALGAARQMVLAGPIAHLADQLEILDEGRIPPEGGDPSPYLALHFDQGHPLFPLGPVNLYFAVGLYRLPSSLRSLAATRLVSLPLLLARRVWGDAAQIERCLQAYARSHGSSWDWQADSGHRVSCFARVLDALNPPARLTNFRTIPKADWYSASKAGHEFGDLAEEVAFYAGCGAPLDPEQRVILRPGDLLLIDNVRAIHGRVGTRPAGELHQFLIGRPGCEPADAQLIRQWLTATVAAGPPPNPLMHPTTADGAGPLPQPAADGGPGNPKFSDVVCS